jgi:hypothetical protein
MAKSEFVNSMNSQVIQQPALEFSFLSSSAVSADCQFLCR